MPKINILSETPQVVFTRPGEPTTVIALTYQVEMGPPRTIWIDEARLPDTLYRRTHPEAKEVPKDILRQGDEARSAAIRADLEKRRAFPPTRTLEV